MTCTALVGGSENGLWEKRGLFTDLCHWVFVPVFTRYLRIWVTVAPTIVPFHISVLYVVLTDFALHGFVAASTGGSLWMYHAVHHASEDLEWGSASRFHPVNLALGAGLVDVVMLSCAGRCAICLRPGFPSLAPRRRSPGQEFRWDFRTVGFDVRHLPYAGT